MYETTEDEIRREIIFVDHTGSLLAVMRTILWSVIAEQPVLQVGYQYLQTILRI